MSLARRVTLLFGVLLAVVSILGVLVVLDVIAQRAAQREVISLLTASLDASHRLALSQAALDGDLARLAITADPTARAQIAIRLDDQERLMSGLVAAVSSDADLGSLVRPVRQAITASRTQIVVPLLTAVDDGRLSQAQLLLVSDRAQESAEAIRSAIREVFDALAQRRAQADAGVERAWRTLLITVLVSLLCIVAAWIAVVRILQRGVLGPVNDIRASLRTTAADRHTPLEVTGPDEIRALATDAEAMRRELVRQADEADAARIAMLQDAPLAAELRETMRPRLPDIDWLGLHGTTRPGEGVIAGDWWDAIARPDGSIAIVIADVSGHGVGAGTAAVQVRAVVESALASGASPADAVALAGHALASSTHFATLAVLVIDDTRLHWVNAGHPAPIVVRGDASDDRCMPTGPIVSRLGGRWEQRSVPFPAESVVIAFTDGLIEAVDARGVDLDEGELMRWVHAVRAEAPGDAGELAERIVARARGRAIALADDVTVVCVARPTR